MNVFRSNKFGWTLGIAVCGAFAASAQATVWPLSVGGMKHAMVFWDEVNTGLEVHLEDPGPLALLDDGELHTPPSDVLDGKGYNNQYGFLNGEAFSPPEGAIWVEVLAISPGLETYEGGMRMANVVNHTYAPILNAVGERWMWNQSMNHPWYAAATPGNYSVEYRVYVGDASNGDPLGGYVSDTTQFNFAYAPEPGALALLAFGACGILRRRVR
ncbi:MAG: PEP-CTERM sorting domain-containing protein [Phycisphaerales bacterium]|nr:PEP-CTERM sorting domain-containing protein [Phycisphaerales bacterium]